MRTYQMTNFRFLWIALLVVQSVLPGLALASALACPPESEFGFMGSSGAGYSNGADASVALGTNFGIALTNWQIVLFDAENAVIEDADYDTFFRIVLGFAAAPGDAVVRFDSDSNRFFVILQDPTGATEIGLAVSTSSTPQLSANYWYTYEWDIGPSLHFHNVEIGDDYVYMSALVSNDRTRPLLGYAPKADLLTGTKTSLTWGQVSTWQANRTHHVGCVKDYDRASDIGRFVSFSREESEPYIRLYAVDPPGTGTSVVNIEVDDFIPPPDDVWTAAPSPMLFGTHPDCKSSVLRNGHLWTAHCIGVENSENESLVRWYEIDLDDWPAQGSTPSVVQSGVIDPPGDGVSAIYPAIHVDDNGNMAIAWMQCSTTEYISVYRAVRRHDDAGGALRAALRMLSGGIQAATSLARTADYTMMDEDPTETGVMWAHHMYYGEDQSQNPERQSWLALIDVNRSLTNDLTGPNNPPRQGDYVALTTLGAEPNKTVKWYYSTVGCTAPTEIAGLSVTLDIANAVFLAQTTSDSDGTAVKNFTIPPDFPPGDIWIQAAEFENTSEVIETEVVE